MSTKQLILSVAKYSGLFWLSRRITANKLRILAYHGIWLGSDNHFGNFLFMTAGKFSDRMNLLAKWGYPVITLSQAMDARKQGLPLPHASTVITIDDGWYGSYTEMLPVLEQHNFPATLYLSTYYCLNQKPVQEVALQYIFHSLPTSGRQQLHLTDYQFGPYELNTQEDRKEALEAAFLVSEKLPNDNARQCFLGALAKATETSWDRPVEERWFHFMSPDEVVDASSRNFEFELHTHRHRIKHQGLNSLAEEITINRDHLSQMTGREANHFCYPSGEYEPDLWPILDAENVQSATTTDIGLVDQDSHNMALPRILDGQYVSDLEFEAEMSGFIQLTRTIKKFCTAQAA